MTPVGPRPVIGVGRALVVLLVGVVALNFVRTAFVPADAHFPLNAAFSLYALGVAHLAGLSATELGLSRSAVGKGLRLGWISFAVVSVVVVVAGSLGMLGDGRADTSAPEMALRVLVIIPLGTVVMEELLFRSALHGLLSRQVSPRWAVALGSVLFGLWHVFPASRGDSLTTGRTEAPIVIVLVGTFLATSLAGWAFIWLRKRSGSVLAPMLAHLATNSVTYLVAWVVGRSA